jgi:hypothetical protein
MTSQTEGKDADSMHIDEYEISLARELAVCAGYLRKLGCGIEQMEARHGMSTTEFVERSSLGAIQPDSDFSEWHDLIEAFRHWKEKHDEYQRLLGLMKL